MKIRLSFLLASLAAALMFNSAHAQERRWSIAFEHPAAFYYDPPPPSFKPLSGLIFPSTSVQYDRGRNGLRFAADIWYSTVRAWWGESIYDRTDISIGLAYTRMLVDKPKDKLYGFVGPKYRLIATESKGSMHRPKMAEDEGLGVEVGFVARTKIWKGLFFHLRASQRYYFSTDVMRRPLIIAPGMGFNFGRRNK
jgi:hypothetical protein